MHSSTELFPVLHCMESIDFVELWGLHKIELLNNYLTVITILEATNTFEAFRNLQFEQYKLFLAEK